MHRKQACLLEEWIPQRKRWSPVPTSEKKPRKMSATSTHVIGEVKETEATGDTEVTISEKREKNLQVGGFKKIQS